MKSSKKYLLVLLLIAILAFLFYRREAPVEKNDIKPGVEPEVLETVQQDTSSGSFKESDLNVPDPAEQAFSKAAHRMDVMTEEEREKVRSEVKVMLSSLYVAEKAFFAEYGRYSSDLQAIGWRPDSGEMNVKVGFAEPSTSASINEGENLEARIDSDYLVLESEGQQEPYQYSKWAKDLSLKDLSHYCSIGCTASDTRFEIMAVSRSGPNGEPEAWVINQDKQFIQVTESKER
ncbi:hypothetical protein D3C87_260380 [compost metagenome]